MGDARNMGTSSANSTRQYDLLKNLLTCLEPSEQAHDERVPVEKDRGLLSALSSVRDFHFPDPLNGVGSRKGDDQPQPTTTPRTGIAGDGHLGGLRTAIYGLQDEHQVPRLPRATQLPRSPACRRLMLTGPFQPASGWTWTSEYRRRRCGDWVVPSRAGRLY